MPAAVAFWRLLPSLVQCARLKPVILSDRSAAKPLEPVILSDRSAAKGVEGSAAAFCSCCKTASLPPQMSLIIATFSLSSPFQRGFSLNQPDCAPSSPAKNPRVPHPALLSSAGWEGHQPYTASREHSVERCAPLSNICRELHPPGAQYP
jgi:hypothetical protein